MRRKLERNKVPIVCPKCNCKVGELQLGSKNFMGKLGGQDKVKEPKQKRRKKTHSDPLAVYRGMPEEY
ncbi:hypothetical protein HY988_06780 [Candidatus Micrarchaeota archaeon]|nr:hypothetical protein [Candidatus Micrarchaeota archaeon]